MGSKETGRKVVLLTRFFSIVVLKNYYEDNSGEEIPWEFIVFHDMQHELTEWFS